MPSESEVDKMLDTNQPIIEQGRAIHHAWSSAARPEAVNADPRLRPWEELTDAQKQEFFDIASSMRKPASLS